MEDGEKLMDGGGGGGASFLLWGEPGRGLGLLALGFWLPAVKSGAGFWLHAVGVILAGALVLFF